MALYTTTVPADAQQEDFESLFTAHWGEIYALLYKMLGDEAEDAAQEVFLKLHTKPPRADSNYRAWLYTVATHEGLNRIRSRGRQQGLLGKLGKLWSGSVNGPEDGVVVRGEQERVREVLALMKPVYAKALLMRYEGFDYSELAEVLQVRRSSIGSMLARAENQFARIYGETGGDA